MQLERLKSLASSATTVSRQVTRRARRPLESAASPVLFRRFSIAAPGTLYYSCLSYHLNSNLLRTCGDQRPWSMDHGTACLTHKPRCPSPQRVATFTVVSHNAFLFRGVVDFAPRRLARLGAPIARMPCSHLPSRSAWPRPDLQRPLGCLAGASGLAILHVIAPRKPLLRSTFVGVHATVLRRRAALRTH